MFSYTSGLSRAVFVTNLCQCVINKIWCSHFVSAASNQIDSKHKTYLFSNVFRYTCTNMCLETVPCMKYISTRKARERLTNGNLLFEMNESMTNVGGVYEGIRTREGFPSMGVILLSTVQPSLNLFDGCWASNPD